MMEDVRVHGFASQNIASTRPLRVGVVAEIRGVDAPVHQWIARVSRWIDAPAALDEWAAMVSDAKVVRGHVNSDDTQRVLIDSGARADLAELARVGAPQGPDKVLLHEGVVVVGPALARWWARHGA